jgi:hypothetical protein
MRIKKHDIIFPIYCYILVILIIISDKIEFIYIKYTNLLGSKKERRPKVVIYSCLIGNYDSISSFSKQKEFDYILFTDQKIEKTNWTILPIPKFVDKFNLSNIKKQRYIKIHPHKFFKKYDLSIYIDANYVIKGDLNDFLINTLNPIDNIYITHLQFGKTPKTAISTAIKNKLDNFEVLNNTFKRYDNEALNKEGIVNAGLMVRKHNNIDCIKLMKKWWKEIKNYSHVDNFSFNYAAYKTGVRFLYISYQFTLDYFGHKGHLKKINY